MKPTMPKVPVVMLCKDGTVATVMGDHEGEAVHTKDETYLPQSGDWRLIQHNTWKGKTKTRGIVVHEGHPMPVSPPGQDAKWPNAGALKTYYRANLAEGLSRRARGMSPRGDLMKSLMGLPKPVLLGILGVVAVILFIAMSPEYMARVFGG